jgi:tRNA uridine 5-carbamoylmethylation protein Kti12
MSKLIKIFILSGIPGCGKSTWAKNLITQNPDTKRINRDDLRKMLDDNRYTEGNENFVNKSKLALIKIGIESEKDMIIDDTHCYNDYLIWLIDEIRKYADKFEKTIFIELIDFDIDVDTCIERNNNRDIKVDKSVIYFMDKSKKEIEYDKLFINLHTIIK